MSKNDKKQGNNCAKQNDTVKSQDKNLPAEIQEDLLESFNYYDPTTSGYISMQHFRNILHNFGFSRLTKREQDAELTKHDPEIAKRNCVDI